MTPGQSGSLKGKARNAKQHYAADFETTTRADDCRVWSWGIANTNDPDNVELGLDIESFIVHVSRFDSITWFHNLGFDGKFLLDHILRAGFVWTSERGCRFEGTFKTLIDGFGKIYSITVQWFTGKSTEFRDSFKKLPMSVKRVAESFKLDITKGEIEYHKERPVGYVPTEEENEYQRNDVSIVAKAMAQVLSQGMTRLTVSGDALAEYKRLVSSKGFVAAFPVFSFELDAEFRRAYRGGWTYCDPRFSKRITDSGLVLDVNSLYPSVMAYELIPYGEPEFIEGVCLPTADRPLTIFSVEIMAKLKPNHVPCIQIKNSSTFSETEYLSLIDEPTTLMVTNIDWELYLEHYDIDVISYGGGWRFKAARGMFKAYIEKWSQIKANSTGGLREIAKLHLNGLYGKFCTNPTITSKYPVLEDNKLKFKRAPDEIREPVYTPAGVFITSHARAVTIRAAQTNYATFAYADTDSLHLLTDEVPDGIIVHPTDMGAWKLEYKFANAFYIRAKGYTERLHNGNYVTHIAGVPVGVAETLTFDDLHDQNELSGKLTPKIVPGGVILVDTTFTLKV